MFIPYEQLISVNDMLLSLRSPPAQPRRLERETIDACIANVKALPLDVETYPPPREWDAAFTVRYAQHRSDYVVEVKRRLDRARLHHLLLGLVGRPRPRNTRPLLFTDLLPEGLLKVLQAENVDYVDAAGNMALSHPPGLFVRVRGQRLVTLGAPSDTPLTSLTGARVLYALLVDREPGDYRYRDLARLSGASLGAVSSVMQALRQRGYVTVTKTGYRLHRTAELLDVWLTGYTEHVRPRTKIGRFEPADKDLEAVVNRVAEWAPTAGVRWALTGTFAGDVLTRHYRGDRLVLYMQPWSVEFLRRLRWAPAAAGPITVLRPFSLGQLDHGLKAINVAPEWPVASPLLVYAELLADGGSRAVETARRVRERYLGHLAPGDP